MLDRALALLSRDDGPAVFLLDGQTVLLEDYLALRPEEEERVRRLVAAGRLLVGPWYVLADELLPADETLVRNLLLGRADGARFGGGLRVGYSPDAFGHPAALPTILAGFGIERAILWRGRGGTPAEEQDLFRWRGPDGASVLVHHLSPAGYELGANLPTGPADARARWETIRAALSSRATNDALLLLNGADHHAPQGDLDRALAALRRVAPDHRFEVASPEAYFDALHPEREPPEVRGELRSSYGYAWTLQGIHATRARLKAAVAEGERLLIRWAEPQAALAAAVGAADRRALLGAAWRTHLRNCFHDSIGGCTADAVARDVAARARSVAVQARGVLMDALHDRLGQDRTRARRDAGHWRPTLVVVNPSARPRSGVVEATVTVFRRELRIGRPAPREETSRTPAAPAVRRADGSPMPLQVLARYVAYERLDSPVDYPRQDEVTAYRVAVLAEDVPATGMLAYGVDGGDGRDRGDSTIGARAPGAVRAARGRLRASWCDMGPDPRGGFELRLAGGRRHRGLGALASERDDGDTYTFQPRLGDTPREAIWGAVRVVWRGPLAAALARDFRVPGRARGTLYARADARSRLVRFVVEGVNLGRGHRLRIVFPTGADEGLAVADMAYCPVVRRREEYDLRAFPTEWPVATAPMHRYVSAPGGLTVFARDRYEYELLGDGGIAVTLLRAVGAMSRGDLAARPGHAGWPTPTPDAQEPGAFRADLAVAAEAVELDASREPTPGSLVPVERLAEEFHAPLAGLMLRYGIDVPRLVRGPALEGEGLVCKAVKPREQGAGLVLRAVNVTGERVRGAWTLPFDVQRAYRARLDETPVAPLAVVERRVTFEAGPREVVTIVWER